MMAKENIAKKMIKKVKKDNERGARENFIEDLFYDFHRSRVEVYKMNLIRGIFFGFGSVLGATVVVAVTMWVLSFFVQLPAIGETIREVRQSIKER